MAATISADRQGGIIKIALTSNATTTIVTNTTTNLQFQAGANEVWVLEYYGTVTCSGTGGSKFQITAPASTTVEGFLRSTTTNATTTTVQRITAINTLNSTATHTVAATHAPDFINVRIKTSGTAGTVGIGFASVTNGQTTTIFAGGYLIAYKVREV